MKVHPHIEVVGVSDTEPIRNAALRHASALERFDERIVDCRVTLGLWRKHQQTSRLFRVQLEVELPHTKVQLARETDSEPTDDEVEAILRSAVEATCHQIEAALSHYDPNQAATKLSPEQKRLRPLHGRVE